MPVICVLAVKIRAMLQDLGISHHHWLAEGFAPQRPSALSVQQSFVPVQQRQQLSFQLLFPSAVSDGRLSRLFCRFA